MSRVLSYGEALVDFLPDRSGVPLREVETFTKTIGGAPANAAVGLSRLGCDVGLLGKVGADEFGHYLIGALQREGIDVAGVTQTREAKTGITFISLDSSGDRSFLFFREPSADMTIRAEDINPDVIADCTVFVAGSNLLTAPEVRAATMFALQTASELERFVVLDPNIRPHLWHEPAEMIPTVRRELDFGDIVKLNDEELEMMSPAGAAALWDALGANGARALVVTHAGAGAEVFFGAGHVEVAAPSVDVVDTTGAGDGFVAGLVSALMRLTKATDVKQLRARVDEFDAGDWQRLLSAGCYVGSSVCQRLGATPALPTAAEVPWHQFDL